MSLCPYSYYDNAMKLLREYDELESEIKQLTGKDLKCIKALFACGWTLEPPKRNEETNFAKMLELVD